MEMSFLLHVSGIIAIMGSLLYILGDLFLLAPTIGPLRSASELVVDTTAAPRLRRRIYLLNTLNQLPPRRLASGALLGVFATPLVLFGAWQLYQGLRPAGEWIALFPTLLLGSAYVIGAYVHGSFYHLGKTTHALSTVNALDRPQLLGALNRQQGVITAAYAVILACTLVSCMWIGVLIGMGATLFPRWMAAVNVITLTLLWLGVKKLLPQRVRDVTQGAGFNIAALAFFALTTFTLW